MSAERRGQTLALLISLLVHALLLSLTFGGQGLGLPGLGVPWQDRRAEAPALRVVLVPVQLDRPVADEPLALPKTDALAAPAAPVANGATPLRAAPPTATVPTAMPAPAVVAVAGADKASWTVSAPPAVIAPTPGASSPEPVTPSLQESVDAARERALELARLDQVKQEALRQAEQMEAERQDAARQATARQEAARQDAVRQDAIRQETARAETARLEAERQEATRQASARQEAARQESARQDAPRQEAARAEAARLAEVQAAAALREAKLKAIGRQLNEEADRRDAAAAAAARLPSSSSARRGRLFGRTDANAELVLYAEAWARKIQLNMTFDSVREAAQQPHTDPLVTVAIRSDGSVESVNFVRSSGVAALDEAIRRTVLSQANYPAFQPGLAREFDVVEIRRTWHFDAAIRLY